MIKKGDTIRIKPEWQLQERDKALTAMDLEWARKMLPIDVSEQVLLMAMHKARYECTAIDSAARHASMGKSA